MDRFNRSQNACDVIIRKDPYVVERVNAPDLLPNGREPDPGQRQTFKPAWLVTWGESDAAGTYAGQICRSWGEVATFLDEDRYVDQGVGLLNLYMSLYLAARAEGYVRLQVARSTAGVTGGATRSESTLRIDWAEIEVEEHVAPTGVYGLPAPGTPEHQRPLLVAPAVAPAMRALGLRHGAAVYTPGNLYTVPGLGLQVAGYLVLHPDLTLQVDDAAGTEGA